ncbi:hypothetical protein BgiBS90_038336 [Biomphalaria glabrata]|nr:hypothetical protein BgiBS90_038336 [Biomphalaria glabrata]
MGSQYSVTGPYCHTFSVWISWAVKTPSPGHMATHSPSPIHGQSRLRHRAIWPHIFFLDIMGSQDSVTGPYGHTSYFWIIMGSQDSVTGPYGHIFSFPDIMGIQGFVTSTVYGDTISFSEIMGSKYSVTSGHMASHSSSSIS